MNGKKVRAMRRVARIATTKFDQPKSKGRWIELISREIVAAMDLPKKVWKMEQRIYGPDTYRRIYHDLKHGRISTRTGSGPKVIALRRLTTGS